jgi:hypothetical protein
LPSASLSFAPGKLGAHARERLTYMPFTSEVNVRGVGFIIGVELEREREAKRVKRRCCERPPRIDRRGDPPAVSVSHDRRQDTLDHGLDITGSDRRREPG